MQYILIKILIFALVNFSETYIKPTDPAVKPTIRKNANSDKSLGNEFTIRLI